MTTQTSLLLRTATDDGGLSVTKSFDVQVADRAGATITGSAYGDIISGTQSASRQPRATAEADIVNTGAGNDTVYALAGNDRIDGGTGNDTLFGDAGGDWLRGGAGADRLEGGAGNDTFLLTGTEGLGDVMRGGEGADTVQVTGAPAVTLSQFDAGAASIEGWQGNGAGILGTTGADTLNLGGLQSLSGVSYIDTGAGNDTIRGSYAADDLRGGAGNDTLYGNAGNDRLTGGAGADMLDGGAGNDTFLFGWGDAMSDSLQGGAGYDTAQVAGTSSVTLGQFNVAAASLEAWHGNGQGVLGTSADNILDFGNMLEVTGLSYVDAGAGNDRLVGSAGIDDLRGGLGNDTLFGGAGDDVLRGGAGNDLFAFAGDFGNDRITDFQAGATQGDAVSITDSPFASLDDLLGAARQVGGDVVIDVEGMGTLTLENVELDNLHENNFQIS